MPDRGVAKVLRTTEEALAPAWRKLWREDPRATPFQSPEWLLAWWHEFGRPDLRAVLISRDETPVGLLPFYLYREPGTHERRLLPIGISTTDYLAGMLAHTGHAHRRASAEDPAQCHVLPEPSEAQRRAGADSCGPVELARGV